MFWIFNGFYLQIKVRTCQTNPKTYNIQAVCSFSTFWLKGKSPALSQNKTVVLPPFQENKEIITFVQINPKEHFYINIHMILDCRMLQNIYTVYTLTYGVFMVLWNTAWTSRVSETMPKTINGWSINWSTPDRNTLALHLYVNICWPRSIPTLQTQCSLKKISWKCSLSAAWGQALRKGQRQTTSRLESVGSTSVCSHFTHVSPPPPRD